MMLEQPKFQENEEWYYNDETNELWKTYEVQCLRLTDKAPKEAVESYLEYCTALYSFNLHEVPEFVYEEYRKHMARFNQTKN